MAVNEQGHAGKYSGNSRHSYNHAHTRVTAGNYEATKKDDEAHMDYLKRDVLYDAHHGHSDEKMTADEKHISKLAGDLKYDEKHHAPGKHHGPGDFRGGYHKVLHAEGKAHQGPGKSKKKESDKSEGGKPKKEKLDSYLKAQREKKLEDLRTKWEKPKPQELEPNNNPDKEPTDRGPKRPR